MIINTKTLPEYREADETYRESIDWWIDKGLHARAVKFNDTDVVLEFTQHFATAVEAVQFAQRFPKAAKVKTNTLSGRGWTAYTVKGQFKFVSNGVTGERNDAAIKRFRSFDKAATKQGLEFTWTNDFGNSISYEEVEAHIA